MFRKCFIFFVCVVFSFDVISSIYVNKMHKNPLKVRFYPKKSVFRKSDLIDKGCSVFIKDCPREYKTMICARHYDGRYETFNNYCEMEHENCNSWRKWSMIKRNRC